MTAPAPPAAAAVPDPVTAAAVGARIAANVGLVVKGKPDVVRLALVSLLAEGHLLVEDVPGTGKTSLARALAGSVAASWQRVQFTPDLLPSDVTGVTIWNQARAAFEFHPGPVFAHVVLADEINRASPKTQSALLEVMEERRVTVDGQTHDVPRPFMVVGTQNPIEMDGTYRLPEAQLDRFLLRVTVGYPDAAAEGDVLDSQGGEGTPFDRLRPVVTIAELRLLVLAASRVHLAPAIRDYIISLVAATRKLPELRLGASPRGSLALARATRAMALLGGRGYVVPEDVKMLVPYVLGHRLLLTPQAELAGTTTTALLERVLAAVPTPTSAQAVARSVGQ